MRQACLCVCLSVCPHAYLKNYTSKLHEICCIRVSEAVVRSSSNENGISDVLPVLWMTSLFSHNGRCGVWHWQRVCERALQQVAIKFQRIHQVEPHSSTLSPYTEENCAPEALPLVGGLQRAGAKSAVYDCLGVIVTTWVKFDAGSTVGRCNGLDNVFSQPLQRHLQRRLL